MSIKITIPDYVTYIDVSNGMKAMGLELSPIRDKDGTYHCRPVPASSPSLCVYPGCTAPVDVLVDNGRPMCVTHGLETLRNTGAL
jgi:hypothetical protein